MVSPEHCDLGHLGPPPAAALQREAAPGLYLWGLGVYGGLGVLGVIGVWGF